MFGAADAHASCKTVVLNCSHYLPVTDERTHIINCPGVEWATGRSLDLSLDTPPVNLSSPYIHINLDKQVAQNIRFGETDAHASCEPAVLNHSYNLPVTNTRTHIIIFSVIVFATDRSLGLSLNTPCVNRSSTYMHINLDKEVPQTTSTHNRS